MDETMLASLLLRAKDDRIADLKKELEAASSTMERERTALAAAVTNLDKAIAPHLWLRDSRGCYEWDDDKWMSEFRTAMDGITDAVRPLRSIAADWTNCSRNAIAVEKARTNWQKRAETAEEKVRTLLNEEKNV